MQTKSPATMKTKLDARRFGPWALITGASSGIGREFAHQIAASGISTVLVARRGALLEELGRELEKAFNVQWRTIVADLSMENAADTLIAATQDLDIGLVVSNAGTGNPARFLSISPKELTAALRLNTLAHLGLARHFAQRLVDRGRGGLLLVGAMGADHGIPYMANDAGAKAYVHSFAQSLHVELKTMGVHVTVLATPPTDTPVLAKFGLRPETMPLKPMTADRCVGEALTALQSNQSRITPGRLNRIMSAVVPGSVTRRLMASMFAKVASK
jgi:short-subunit dehydrogenase